MICLIDGDILVYKSSFSAQYQTYTLNEATFRYKKDLNAFINANYEEDEAESLHNYVTVNKVLEPFIKVKAAINQIMEGVFSNLGTREYEVYISGKNNFRLSVPYPVPYKGGRSEKPHYFKEARQYLKDNWMAKEVDGMETDDMLGQRQKDLGDNCIVASIDKDLLQSPGKHYHLDRKELTIVTQIEAFRNFGIQMLIGDDVDNILGCKGIGPKKAEKILEGLTTQEEIYKAVKAQYEKSFGDEADNMFQSNFLLLALRVK